ncbi:hypothetical protein KC992_04905 [Candidatus Saccharibacteria bacterium]|nr:hypothetical protein [Candidatus Saccharibacteria bacterium]
MAFENGELDFTRAAQEHLLGAFTSALGQYAQCLAKKGAHPASKANARSNSDSYHQRRLRILGFADYSFGRIYPERIHPKARLFTAGAVATRDALRLYWTRKRQSFKNGMLDFVLEDALTPDRWATQDAAYPHLEDTTNSLFADNPDIAQALCLPGDDRVDAQVRAFGAGWLCTIASPVELLDIHRNPGKVATTQMHDALAILKAE